MLPFFKKNKMVSVRALLIILVLCVSVPSLSLLWWLRNQREKQALEAVGYTAMEIARGVAVAEQLVDLSTLKLLERVHINPIVQELDFENMEKFFFDQNSFSEFHTDILLADASGDVLVSGAHELSGNLFKALSIDVPITEKVSILPGHCSKGGKMFVPYVMGILPDGNNVPRYILAALVDVSVYSSTRAVEVAGSWTLSMVDSNGVYLFRYPPEEVESKRYEGEPLFDPVWKKIQQGDDEGWFRGLNAVSLPGIFGFVKLRRSPEAEPYATIITLYLEDQALASTRREMALSLLVMFYLIGMSGVLAAFMGIRYLSQPLEKFLETTKCFAEGDLTARSDIDYNLGEIGTLARAFDTMADVLEAQKNQQKAFEAELEGYGTRQEELVKERTRELEESQKRTQLILNSTTEGILELDTQNRISFLNRAALTILQKSEKDLLSHDFFVVLPHTGRDGEFCSFLESPIREALMSKEGVRVPKVGFLRENDRYVSTDVYIAPVFQDGVRTGTVLALVDLSDALDAHEMMDAIYRTTSNGYVSISEDLKILDCNPAMMKMLGVSNKEHILNDFMAYSPPFQPDGRESREKFEEFLAQAQEEGSQQINWLHINSDEEPVPCEVTLTLISVNYRRMIVGSVHDLRDQMRAQEALTQQREQLESILDSTPLVVMISSQSKVQTINQNGTRLLGLRPGDTVLSIYENPEDRIELLRLVESGEVVTNRPMRIRNGSGNIVETLFTLIPFDYEGECAYLCWLVDVTELAEARRVAEKAAGAQSDFLARMSHEIRTPMNAILGMTHLCLLTEMSDKQRNYLDKIHSAANSLLALINDILDISKIKAGKLTLENVPFSLSQMLKSLWDMFSFRAEEKGLVFAFDMKGEAPDALIGDPLRLNQVLLNLCNNAVKFTEKGEIIVRVSVQEPFEHDEESLVRFEFSVTDTGIGMTPDQLESLFTPFTQAETSITRKYGGSGLGLSICKSLVESMGGWIQVESVFGKGSTVCFSVPLRLGEAPEHPSTGIFGIRGLRVLVVDDDDDAREILREQGANFELRMEVAASGKTALTMIGNAIEQNDPYFLVFLDWRMPGMDGEQTALRIRELFGAKAPKIAMISSYCEDDCRKLAEKVEASIFLPKPIGSSDLYDTLVSISAGSHARKDGAETATATSPMPPLTGEVLLVEDNLINQEIALELLRQRGLEADVAGNGQEALEAVKKKRYDLIFMDIQMPVMNGFEAAETIRTMPEFSADRLPIVAMTAHAMSGDYEKSLAAGMNDHITKPINPDEFDLTLDKWIQVGQKANKKNGPSTQWGLGLEGGPALKK